MEFLEKGGNSGFEIRKFRWVYLVGVEFVFESVKDLITE